MTLTFSVGDQPSDAVLAVTEDWLKEAAEGIALTVLAIRRGEFAKVKEADSHVRALRAAMELFIDERNRVEKLRKQVVGAVGATELDIHAARDEIGRRLARLRNAG